MASPILATVTGIELNALLDQLAREGVRVMRAELPGDMDGAYMLRSRTILLDTELRDWQVLPVLLHETMHWHRGDDGPQCERVERQIDETVARLLVDPDAYRLAEARYGWHTGGIATELDLPRWVIQAYRRTIERDLRTPSAAPSPPSPMPASSSPSWRADTPAS